VKRKDLIRHLREHGCELLREGGNHSVYVNRRAGKALDFMPDYGLTVAGLAQALGVSRQSVNELLRGRRAVSPEMALRLSRLFGNSPDFWLNAQRAVDLWDAAQAIKDELDAIEPLSHA